MLCMLKGKTSSFFFQAKTVRCITQTMIEKYQEKGEHLELYCQTEYGVFIKMSETETFDPKTGTFEFDNKLWSQLCGLVKE